MHDHLVVYAIGCYYTQYYVELDQLNGYCLVCNNKIATHKHTRNEAVINKDVMESFIAMVRAVRKQAAATTLMAKQIANQNGNGNGNGHGNGYGDDYMQFLEFCKANPHSFRGIYNLDVANKWIKETEQIFSILTYIEEQKVSFAAFMLKEDVEFWQNGTRNLLENDGTLINWEFAR